jgi:hypothetical protein
MSDVTTSPLKVTGKGHCKGGVNPHPPFHDYPLLAWTHLGHPQHGDNVFTEDQKASVHDIALAVAETPNHEAVAAKFGTTVEHVNQAVAYACKSGFLGG